MSHISYLHTWWTWRRWSYLIVLASGVTNMSYNMQVHLSCLPCLNASDIWSVISIVTRWMSQSLMDQRNASIQHPLLFLPTICYPFNAIFTVLSGASCTPSSSKLQTFASLHLVLFLVPLFQKGERTWAPRTNLRKIHSKSWQYGLAASQQS